MLSGGGGDACDWDCAAWGADAGTGGVDAFLGIFARRGAALGVVVVGGGVAGMLSW